MTYVPESPQGWYVVRFLGADGKPFGPPQPARIARESYPIGVGGKPGVELCGYREPQPLEMFHIVRRLRLPMS